MQMADAMQVTQEDYRFSNHWFDQNAATWDQLFAKTNPTRILEIGCFEGRSTCYLIEKLAHQSSVEIHCIDTWQGGIEHGEGGLVQSDMNEIEARFQHNIRLAISKAGNSVNLVIHKGLSSSELPKLIAAGQQGSFDFIYIDGSHQAPDVLHDAVSSFILLKKQGVIAFDDYLWQEPLPGGTDPIRCPKIAIDAFTNIYCRKLRVIQAPLNQLYVQKISD